MHVEKNLKLLVSSHCLSLFILLMCCPPQKAVAVIPAHDTALAALAFNQSGSKLATASTTVSNGRLWLLRIHMYACKVLYTQVLNYTRNIVHGYMYCTSLNNMCITWNLGEEARFHEHMYKMYIVCTTAWK